LDNSTGLCVADCAYNAIVEDDDDTHLGSCDYCPEDEYIRSNICLASCLVNEVVSDDGFFCDCNSDYVFDFELDICMPTCSVENCTECIPGNVNACNICDDYFFLNGA